MTIAPDSRLSWLIFAIALSALFGAISLGETTSNLVSAVGIGVFYSVLATGMVWFIVFVLRAAKRQGSEQIQRQ